MHAAYVIVPPTNKVRSNPSGGAAYMDDEGKTSMVSNIALGFLHVSHALPPSKANAPNVC